jgi:hypothetical protein
MLIVVFALALPFPMQDTLERHAHATKRSILALTNAGIARSATFRDLIGTLNASDVIVSIEPKVTRPHLRGYLANQIVAEGDRYMRIAIETSGSQNRLVRLLAHELQHAVEVAQAPEARDEASLRRALASLAVRSGARLHVGVGVDHRQMAQRARPVKVPRMMVRNHHLPLVDGEGVGPSKARWPRRLRPTSSKHCDWSRFTCGIRPRSQGHICAERGARSCAFTPVLASR